MTMETTQNVAPHTTSPSEPPPRLRLAVVGGGCSGFQYSLDLEKEQRAGDLVFEVKGVRCFVDPMSSMYLMGVEIDYVEGQFGQSGFSFKNPNAKHTCGCGSSFSA